LNYIFKEKRHENFTKIVVFLHDNAPAHQALATQTKLAYLGFQCLNHPPYSPDLAPLDHHLLAGLKRITEKSPFFFRRKVIVAAETSFDGKFSDIF
jgi:histone-lysine N-methyltransferase SETMAR